MPKMPKSNIFSRLSGKDKRNQVLQSLGMKIKVDSK
jgi:hypothetical protein